MTVIRPARESDIPAVLSLIRELAAYEHLAHQVAATPELMRDHLFGARPVAEALIAEHAGVTVGYALFFYTFSTFLARPGIYLEDVYVQPAHRGKGIGKKILVHLARLARDRQYGRIEWSVLKWNKPSIEFYEKVGAKPLDEWTMYRLTGSDLDALAGN